MDKIIKAVLFGGKARVALIETTETVNKAIKTHDLTPLAAAALGRSLTIGAYIESNLKSETHKFNLIINGGGPIGKIYVTSDRVGTVKGLVENPQVDLPLRKDGKLDVGGAVGTNGDIVVIKDLGLKEPYIGRSQLVSGEIAEDYNNYLFKSEGILNAVALGVLNDKDGCKAAGGIIIEAMPDADDNMVCILEDIMSNFTNISALIAEKGIEEIGNYYFGHLDAEFFPAQTVRFKCDCWHKIRKIVRGLGRAEIEDIMKEQGMLEIKCDYCRKNYVYTEKDLDFLFEEE
ncbi:MAG: Hsp33 family molecular chaperone HslO [Clostridia bacterium]|nr:Hsp33 family molecular chaperone HslO [Clostridia bacterium]